jgi:hypothetical protein
MDCLHAFNNSTKQSCGSLTSLLFRPSLIFKLSLTIL